MFWGHNDLEAPPLTQANDPGSKQLHVLDHLLPRGLKAGNVNLGREPVNLTEYIG